MGWGVAEMAGNTVHDDHRKADCIGVDPRVLRHRETIALLLDTRAPALAHQLPMRNFPFESEPILTCRSHIYVVLDRLTSTAVCIELHSLYTPRYTYNQ